MAKLEIVEGWQILEKDQQIAELEEQLAITEKALELVIKDKDALEKFIEENLSKYGASIFLSKNKEWYIEQAKEMKDE